VKAGKEIACKSPNKIKFLKEARALFFDLFKKDFFS
jgi:hypothetical protein